MLSGNGDGPDDMIDEKPPTEVHLINKSIETEEGESLKKQKYSITSKDEENTSKYEENSLPDSPGRTDFPQLTSYLIYVSEQDNIKLWITTTYYVLLLPL